MKKYLLVLLLIVFIVPSVAFASWYNPFSWFNNWSFHKTETNTEYPIQKITTPTTTADISNKVTIPPVSTKQNNFPVAKKITPQKNIIQPKQVPQVAPPLSTTCVEGSFFDKSTGGCINSLTYCQNQNGLNATYDSVKNSCECATGYTLNSNNICSVPKTGYQICSEQFPNETWDGTTTDGKYNCVCKTDYVLNSSGTGCEIPQVNNVEQQTQNPKLDSLKSQFFQVIDDINTDCNNAYAGQPVAKCKLTESKLQTILEQEAAIGISKQEAAPQLSALQDAYNRLQTEYYSAGMRVADNQYILGIQANIAAEMQILANYKAMFTN